jgi:hypothetical protein
MQTAASSTARIAAVMVGGEVRWSRQHISGGGLGAVKKRDIPGIWFTVGMRSGVGCICMYMDKRVNKKSIRVPSINQKNM